jgi:hypothetical protein
MEEFQALMPDAKKIMDFCAEQPLDKLLKYLLENKPKPKVLNKPLEVIKGVHVRKFSILHLLFNRLVQEIKLNKDLNQKIEDLISKIHSDLSNPNIKNPNIPVVQTKEADQSTPLYILVAQNQKHTELCLNLKEYILGVIESLETHSIALTEDSLSKTVTALWQECSSILKPYSAAAAAATAHGGGGGGGANTKTPEFFYDPNSNSAASDKESTVAPRK